MVSQLRIFIFKSEAKPDLRAFGSDLAVACCGRRRTNQQPPYNLPRDVIERAIKDQGFQPFRLSKAE